MNKQLISEFLVDKDKKTITIEREFDAELPLVWNAYTQPELLARWWAPKPWQVKTRIMDFRDGGSWHYAMVSPEGQEHWCRINYQKIVPQVSYTATDCFTDAEGNENHEMPSSNWYITFHNQGATTLVRKLLSFDDLAQLENIIKMGFKEGITMTMDALNAMLPEWKKKA
ncbi:MAG: SRPBCC domain-containing protein [Flavobacteriales bacterium]|nr:SRPBCC domain-containing protein [Flavobacteriales bacterium]MCB9448367.1 SRPBCC domain-containing protein [Flavobacteriales bacterium]